MGRPSIAGTQKLTVPLQGSARPVNTSAFIVLGFFFFLENERVYTVQ